MLTVAVSPLLERFTNETVPDVFTRPSLVRMSEAGIAEAYVMPSGRALRLARPALMQVQPAGAAVLKLMTTLCPVAMARERCNWMVWTRLSLAPRSCCVCGYFLSEGLP